MKYTHLYIQIPLGDTDYRNEIVIPDGVIPIGLEYQCDGITFHSWDSLERYMGKEHKPYTRFLLVLQPKVDP